jgi:hypothetical protein
MATLMTAHQLPPEALDRRLSIAERKAALAAWAEQHAPHWHPGQPAHRHLGGDRIHDHKENR